jgi:uncharacterized protein (TIGR00375 family)
LGKQRSLDDYIAVPIVPQENIEAVQQKEEAYIQEGDYIVDLHLHSRYSRATSEFMDLPGIARNSKIKGLSLIGSGDALHPAWLKELKELLRPAGGEFYEYQGLLVVPTAEVSTVFEDQLGKTHKIHQLLVFPDLSVAEGASERLGKYGDLNLDGRPTLTIDPPTLMDELYGAGNDIEIIPAHIWTPWFSLFGSNSGFNNLKECYRERSDRIHSLETGLSSDPEMNWMISSLDKYNLLSNSDAHSHHPWRLGREANVFTLREPGYKQLLSVLRGGDGLKMTLEVPPEFGKYHWTGHRTCGVSMPPEEALKRKNICPVCGRTMTIGVEQRVYELADRPRGFKPNSKPSFIRVLPLHELIMFSIGSTAYGSKKVQAIYRGLTAKFGNEYKVLLDASLHEIEAFDPTLAGLIGDMRSNNLKVEPGYDGVYGRLVHDGKTLSPQVD